MWNLTPDQYEEIIKIIDKHTQVMLYVMVGGQVPPIDLLKKMCIPSNAIPMIKTAYTYGKLAQLMEESQHKSMTFEQLKKEASRMALTAQEKLALKWAENHAARYVSALGTAMRNTIIDTIDAVNKQQLAQAAERKVINDSVVNALVNRDSRSSLVTQLRGATQDFERDWHRVAHTEMWDAKLHGTVMSILSGTSIFGVNGGNTRVYKKPRPDACEGCKRVYLEEDGITPKIFLLKDLLANGDNYNKRMADWKAVAGTTHPNCACTLSVLPDGFGFDTKGEITFIGG